MSITRSRLEELLNRFAEVRIAVVGDFFLDRYWLIDAALDEPSLETGLTAEQVTERRFSPGAAGTVVNNLAALGLKEIFAVGFDGDDGEGFELRKQLALLGINMAYFIKDMERNTPCYTKPLKNGVELNRFDIKNRSKTSAKIERHIVDSVEQLLPDKVDAVMIMDQVSEPDCGVITANVRNALLKLSDHCTLQGSKVFFYADSRENIGLFRNMIIKCNEREAAESFFGVFDGKPLPFESLKLCGTELSKLRRKPVFITRGAKGMLAINGSDAAVVPAVKVEGEIDICGAGDAVSAALVSALCAGATPEEAAFIGNTAASVTIRKLGQTGTATPEEILHCAGLEILC
ncbi:MAG: PfkB family carbohydrate kinase [Planctomycetaceae bacterium]|nr:PfkB family carbohydrate kinase [Planctomycetaceae bacterium]